MNWDELLEAVPAYSLDLKLNCSSLMQRPGIPEQQAGRTIVVSAMVEGLVRRKR